MSSAPFASIVCILCCASLPSRAEAAEGARSAWLDDVYVEIAERFTHYGTLQFEGNEVRNSTGQYHDSFTTQIVAGYRISPRLALQLNVPLIYRSFERPKGFAVDRGTESGIGDGSLLANAVVFLRQWDGRRTVDLSESKGARSETNESHVAVAVSLLVGVKFPSGGTSRLKEEFNQSEIPGTPKSGIHGHDLTLGSGSFDGIFGAQVALRCGNFFFETGTVYALRSEGSHHYEYADDVSWFGGPGLHFVRNRGRQLSLQCLVSGELKGRDRFRGEAVEDSAITSALLGPRVLFSLGKWNGEIGVQLPVVLDNSGLQVVLDYRLHGALTMRF